MLNLYAVKLSGSEHNVIEGLRKMQNPGFSYLQFVKRLRSAASLRQSA